jgi:homoserine kinase
MKTASIAIRIPGSTSNLGPGFDTLGLALNVYAEVELTILDSSEIELRSPVPTEDRAGAMDSLARAAELFFNRSNQSARGFEVSLGGDLPVARGLGYSAAVRLGVIAGLNELTRAGWTRQQLLEAVTELEGHPDNASPSVYGGFAVSSRLGTAVRCLHFPVSEKAQFVTLIPPFGIATAQARALIPESFSRADAAHNLNRAALIAAGLASGNLEALRGTFEDRIHQPYRERLIPQLSRVLKAGERAGAIGGWLSGSGSAIVCLTLENKDAVMEAMHAQLPEAKVKVLQAENHGYWVRG